MVFRPEAIPAFEAMFWEKKSKIAGFPGCQKVELHRDATEPGVRYTISVWESNAALQAYRQSELFAGTWAQTKQWFAGKPQAWSLYPQRPEPPSHQHAPGQELA